MAIRALRQSARRCLLALALATPAAGQAAVEYAARAAGNSVSSAGSDMHVGVCLMNAGLVRCVHDYYPTAFIVITVGLGLMLLAVIVRTFRPAR